MIFTEEQELFRKSVREFAEKELAPYVPQILETNTIPQELYEKAAEVGIINANYPVEWGGLGLGQVETCIIFDEICAVCAGFGMAVEITLVSGPLFLNKDMYEKYMPVLMSGKSMIAACGTSPTGQYNTPESAPIFTKVDGGYLVNGTRVYATNHDSFVGKVYGFDQEGNYLYGLYDRDSEGVYPQGSDLKVGLHGSHGGTVVYKDLFIPDGMMGPSKVGKTNGYYQVYTGCGAEALGVAKGIFRKALEWCKTRTHDFKPIIEMTAVHEKLAELQMKILTAESVIYAAAEMQDKYYETGDEDLGNQWRMMAHTAKVQASEMLVPVVYECIKLFGGMGVHDPNIHHYMGDILDYTHMDLTNEIHYGLMAELMGIKEEAIKS